MSKIYKKNIFFLLSSLLIINFYSFANTEKQIDSLSTLMQINSGLIQKLTDKISAIEFYYQKKDPIKGINIFSNILKNSLVNKNDTILTFITASLANLYSKLDRYDQAGKLYYISQKYARKINNIGVIAWHNISLGNLYFRFSNTLNAKEYYKKSYLIADSVLGTLEKNEIKKQKTITAYNFIKTVASENIGMCFQIEGQNDSAYYYLTKYSSNRLNDKNQLNAQYYLNILSEYFLNVKKPDSVIKYSMLALNIDTTTFDVDFYASNKYEHLNFKNKTYLNLLMAYYFKKYADSIRYYEKKLLHNTAKSIYTINNVNLMFTLANFYFSQKDFQKCVYVLEKIFNSQLDKYDNTDLNHQINKLIAVSYSEIGDYKKANRLYSKLVQQIDSILLKTRLQSLSSAETDVNLMENLEKIENLEEKSHFQQVKLEDQNIQNKLYLYLLFAAFLILIVLVFTYFNNKKHLTTINQKNQELNKLNEKLEKSIKMKDEINVELTVSQHELQKINETLEAANQTKNKLFSIIAHDMKNAIGGMRALNQYLFDDYDKIDNDEKRELVFELNASSLEIHKLMENLLIWSSSQRGKIQPHKEDNLPHYVSISSITLY